MNQVDFTVGDGSTINASSQATVGDGSRGHQPDSHDTVANSQATIGNGGTHLPSSHVSVGERSTENANSQAAAGDGSTHYLKSLAAGGDGSTNNTDSGVSAGYGSTGYCWRWEQSIH